ncbi:vacuolar protein sorting protein VPS23 [Acrasis kona]|uniref:Vacuolar protein sorting protein VPS23 n=1 Tax=Acrasis kona TaxID=1008807 RepID=A0AAW2Z9H7_9EUKA
MYSTSDGARYLQQTLDGCMAQLGYVYQQTNIPRIKLDVMTLINNLPTLTPKIGTMKLQNERVITVLTLQGTIPMYYRNEKYNIPVKLFIPEMYPYHPPLSYVDPNESMIIKPRHPHVDSTGRCYLPYLSEWNAQKSNLYELINHLSAVFGQEPPVFQKSNVQTPPPPPTSTLPPSQYPSPQYNPSATNNPYSTQPHLNYQNGPQQIRETIRRQLISKIEYKLRPLVEDTTKSLKAELDTQDELNSRSQKLTQLNDMVGGEEKVIDDELEALNKKLAACELYIQNHESKGIDVDKAIEPEDIYSKQILDLIAEENAIDDFVYYLDKALQYKSIDLDTFLNFVREASRQQFMKKALLKKISLAQQQQK